MAYKQKIKRMIGIIDESLPKEVFYPLAQAQAQQAPLEITEEGSRFRFVDCYQVPGLLGSKLYMIGVYEEIEEVEPLSPLALPANRKPVRDFQREMNGSWVSETKQ